MDVVDPRDRVDAEAFEKGEAKHVAVLGRELGEGLVDGRLVGGAVLRDDLRHLGITRGRRHVEQCFVGGGGSRVGDATTARVERRAHHDRAQPRTERASAAVVEDLRRRSDEELLANGLEDLVDEIAIGAEGRQRCDHVTAIGRIEVRERGGLPRGARARKDQVDHLDRCVPRRRRPSRHVRLEDLVGERERRKDATSLVDPSVQLLRSSHASNLSVLSWALEHLDENDILALLEHRMAKEQRASIESHLDACPACLELLAMVASASPTPLALQPTELDVTRHLTASRLSPGDLLADRFRLERVVGEGGMGVVWAARDERAAQAEVALKILKEVTSAEKRRFLREAEVMQSFDHPGILDVKEVVAVGEDILLVMDLLEGESLGARLGRVGRLEIGEAVTILLPLLDATIAAHARGVVHRDLKPENVFLCADGRVVLLDFGMAKLTASFDLAMSGWMTESGLILGTPHYMAPEQIYGERDVDARADVWALGVVTYECLSGERPVSGKSFGQIVRALQRREIVDLAERIPSMPAPLLTLVRRMLSHERLDRPSLDEVRAALAAQPPS